MALADRDTTLTGIEESVAIPAQNDCLVIIYHSDKSLQGQRTNLDGVKQLGRLPENDIVLEDGPVSRHHAVVERDLAAGCWVLRDLNSKNGTFLNDRPLAGQAPLRNGDRVKIGYTILKYLSGADVEASFIEEIYQLNITDHLTRLANRLRLEDQLQKEFLRARRHDRELALLFIDIDHFKNVNDVHGHQAGDAVLTAVGQLLRTRARSDDLPARLGGEEFVVLLPETNLAGAAALAEDLRAAIETLVVDYDDQRIQFTISVGCAELEERDKRPDDLLNRADEKLYSAKRSGRNRVSS
ncbi:MAG TPA: GGDEF domain-containing protein [Polyangiaceae bacterium]|nr:GGDEF domain-containing protein [Polyangiaceae bacterium]